MDPCRMPIAGLWDWMGNRRSGCLDCQPSALRLTLFHLLVRLGSLVNFALRESGHLGLGNLYSGRVPSKKLTLQPLSSTSHTQNGSGYSLLVIGLTPLGVPRGEDGLTEGQGEPGGSHHFLVVRVAPRSSMISAQAVANRRALCSSLVPEWGEGI
ncbi:hypothetical protein R1flu_011040 [Riccia fluitans]|uniref:Uncharacterized protein n=1 Tax=Riccia fluitans TaxID=41844 RepID=A0ABD1Z6P0_9MARC